jgi:hypothetical protein
MFEAEVIVSRARRLGLTLQPEGGRIAIAPAKLCPPDLLTALREHKPAVMALLEKAARGLPPDQAPWLHVARQVSEGQFDGGTISQLQAVEKGLRSIVHPTIAAALQRVNALLNRKGAKPIRR